MDPATANFWEQMRLVGQEVLDQGKRMGFGMSLVEIKFQDGTPSVLTRSISVNTKYPDSDQAKIAIANQLEDATSTGFDGARTMTIVFTRGKIQRVLLDEYANHLLK